MFIHAILYMFYLHNLSQNLHQLLGKMARKRVFWGKEFASGKKHLDVFSWGKRKDTSNEFRL